MPAGRPSKYNNIDMKLIEKLARYGHDDKFIADALHINEATLNRWKQSHPEFCKSLKDWKQEADKQVEKALFERARGYKHKAVKIFCNAQGDVTTEEYTEHYPPDTTACIFWLKNRRPDLWRDKSEVEGNMPGVEKYLSAILKRG